MTTPAHDPVQQMRDWWRTSIIEMSPGVIRYRGYAIEELIGRVSFPQMIWLMTRGELPSVEQAALLDAALMSAVDQAIELFEDIARRIDAGADEASATSASLAAFVSAHGKIIPGWGHRFHPIDPRAVPLLALVDAAAAEGVVSGRYARIARAIDAALERGKGKRIPMNIDGATAVIYAELGFAAPLARGLFCLSRSVGILAHAWEQSQQGGRNKGPIPRQYVPSYDGPPPRPLPSSSKGTR